uniref:Uncharacterized protein n=1 Tax=Acrobeloides nanus TaxID=290746 RepID=A0A914DMX9_9BILA
MFRHVPKRSLIGRSDIGTAFRHANFEFRRVPTLERVGT